MKRKELVKEEVAVEEEEERTKNVRGWENPLSPRDSVHAEAPSSSSYSVRTLFPFAYSRVCFRNIKK